MGRWEETVKGAEGRASWRKKSAPLHHSVQRTRTVLSEALESVNTALGLLHAARGPRAERIAILSHCRDQHIGEEAWVESVALRGGRAGTTELSTG